MQEHYDRHENRTPVARETALFRDLRQVLSVARSRAPALRSQIKGIEPARLMTRADLAQIPLRRPADLMALQDDAPPFGGLAAARIGMLCHAFAVPGLPLTLAGPAKDWWGMGRTLFAAGLRKGTLVLNCFAYDLSPLGHMIESGARAIGCPVIPAGTADLLRKVDAMRRLQPRFFCGDAGHLSDLLDAAEDAGVARSLESALVACCAASGKREELRLRGLAVRQVLITPELGPIAYESGTSAGLVVNEGLIAEIVDPATHRPVAAGDEGELVVTRINHDYPVLRLATGLRTKQLPQLSTCGRTNMRIACPREMRPSSVDVGEARVHISQIREIAARHPEAGRLRAYTRRCPRDRDELVLKVEHAADGLALDERLLETLRAITRIVGTIERVTPGTFGDDDALLVDERPLGWPHV